MKILVTGSSGFIGSALVHRLMEEGHTVRAFHRSSSSQRRLEGLDIEHAVGDLTRPETLEKACKGMDVVFHTAAVVGGREEPGRMYAVTVEGTRAVMQASLAAGVEKVVHTSSLSAMGVPDIAGDGQSQVLLDEHHTWNFRPDLWPYGYTKYLAEMEVQRAVAQGLDVVIVNPTVVYGKGDIYRQCNSLVVQIAKRHLPAVVDAGLNIVHIDDVIDGHLAALNRGKRGERYILGGQNMMIQTLVREIAAVIGVSAPVAVLPVWMVRKMALPARWFSSFLEMPVPPETLNLAGWRFYATTRKAVTQLGLEFSRSPQEAIGDAYRWFKENGAI